MDNRTSIWNRAAVSGMALGGVSIAYALLTMLTGRMAGLGTGAAVAANIIDVLLWIAKFAGCILLMRLFMQRMSAACPEADSRKVFRFGMLTSLLYALLYSAYAMADAMLLRPGQYEEAMDVLRANPAMTADLMEKFEEMLPMMPTYTFFANLVYCTLFGIILSAILSRNIPSRNPFADGQQQ